MALRWSDVDLARGTIRVRQAKTDAGVRIVHVLPVLHGELADHRDLVEAGPCELVFGTSSGRPLGASNIRIRVLARAVQRANAELEARARQPLPSGLTPHSLRRTFASLLFAIGEPPTYVMSQMGHTTPGLTLALYAREMSRRDGEHGRLRVLLAASPAAATTTASSTSGTASVRIVGPPRLATADALSAAMPPVGKKLAAPANLARSKVLP
jgi:integrase